jgi:hypothetical protein
MEVWTVNRRWKRLDVIFFILSADFYAMWKSTGIFVAQNRNMAFPYFGFM